MEYHPIFVGLAELAESHSEFLHKEIEVLTFVWNPAKNDFWIVEENLSFIIYIWENFF